MGLFTPDYYFDDLSLVPESIFLDSGTRLVFCDIDNTLIKYSDSKVTDFAAAFLDKLRKIGIKIILITNNNDENRASMFGEKFILKAKKPLVSKKRAKEIYPDITISRENTFFIGDQIFTDVMAGKKLGAKTILVDPLGETKIPFFGIKRALEAPIKKHYIKKHGNNLKKDT